MATSEGYQGNINLKCAGEKIDYTEEQAQEIIRCEQDPSYFIDNYVMIVNVDKGLIHFKLWDFQKDLINTFHDNRFNIVKYPRQSGKSVTTIAYILWSILFNEEYVVAILANKGSLARDQLSRLQKAYEYLPKWLQQGIITWNKGSVELENGSKVFAYATSAAGVRGGSFNLILLDEFAFVPHNMAYEFFQSTYPVISSGKTTKVIIVSCVNKDTFILTDKGIKQVSDFILEDRENNPILGYEIPPYKVLGMNGLNDGGVMVNSGKAETRIIRSQSSYLECSLIHKLWACKNGNFNWYKSEELEEGDYISIKYGKNIWGNNDDISDYIPYETNKFQNQFIPSPKINRELSYFLGLYLAEGYSDENRTCISCGDDISYALESLNLPFNCTDGIHYNICSKSLVHFLRYLGFDLSLKAKEKIIPKRILELSKDNLCSFLSGFFDGDGCATKRGQISVISSSLMLIDQIRIILMNLGILSQYYTGITPPTKKVKVESVYHRLEICSYEMCNRFYDEIGFKLNRKHIRQSLLKIPKNSVTNDIIPFGRDFIKDKGLIIKEPFTFRKTKNISRKRALTIPGIKEYSEVFNKNLKWEKIKKIEKSENKVYDFSLFDTEDKWCHSVVYNGIVGHQTPNGLNMFYKMWMDAVEKRSTYIPSEVHWTQVPGRDEEWKKETIRNTSEEQFRQEFECLDGETILDIYDKLTKEEYRVRAKDLYDDLL